MDRSKAIIRLTDFEFQKMNMELIKSYEDGEKWYVEGFASASNLDEHGDLITPEALEKCVKNEDFSTYSTVLHNHKPDEEIGKVEAYDVRIHNGMKKLWVKILISKTVPKIWQRIKEGVLNKFSIRAAVVDSVRRWSGDVQKFVTHILEMKAKEVSLVGLPANPEAEQLNYYVAKAMKELSSEGGEEMSKKNKDVKKEEKKDDEVVEEEKDDAAADEKKDGKKADVKEEEKDTEEKDCEGEEEEEKDDKKKADDDEEEVEVEVVEKDKKKSGEADAKADGEADSKADGDAAKADEEEEAEEKQEGQPALCKLANQKTSTEEDGVKLCPVAYGGDFGDPNPSEGKPSQATGCPRVKGKTHTCPYLVAPKEAASEEEASESEDGKALGKTIADAVRAAVQEEFKSLKDTVAEIVKDELSNKKFKVKVKGRKSLLKDEEEKEADEDDEVVKSQKEAATDEKLANTLFHR